MAGERHAMCESAFNLGGGIEWAVSRLGRIAPREDSPPSTLCVDGWVGLRAVLDVMDKTKNLSTLSGMEI
jgi:hypothetical protein